MNHLFTISNLEEGKRIDSFIAEKLKIPRTKAQELIEKGNVKINNNIKSKSYKLKINDLIEINNHESIFYEDSEKLVPQNIPLDILYKDEYLAIISKPAGMVVYPCIGHRDSTIMNAIAFHMKKLANVGGPLRPGVVHRLDKETSGVMIIALEDIAYYKLVEMFKKRLVKKEYIAIVYGQVKEIGKIDLPIGRANYDRKKMSTKSKKLKEAITEWEVIKKFKNYTLVKIKIITGRTHQIRVHFSSIGHPVMGDKLYGQKTYFELGKKRIPIKRQMLHAMKIEFPHPITGNHMIFESPIPEDMNFIINILKENNESIK